MVRLAVPILVVVVFGGTSALAAKLTHVVLPGESLSRIAKRYHTTPERIRKLNSLTSDHLREGQRLKVKSPIPVATRIRVRYQVRKGQSLTQVAKKHKISVALLRRLNPKAGSTLRPGQVLWVIKEGPSGSGTGLYQLEEGPGFSILDPRHAFGTMLTVTRVAEVLSDQGIRNPDKAPILVGDISRERGGFLAPHVSHRRGRDVDVRYPLLKPSKQWVAATTATMDIKRTWALLQGFIKTGDVMYVFVDYKLQKALYEHAQERGMSGERLQEVFQYPRSRRSMTGIIRHEPGHKTHLHVRFKADSDGDGPNS